MPDSLKAKRTKVTLGCLTLNGFVLPDGSFRMSLSQAANSVGLTARNTFDFLRSKAFKSSMKDGYTVPVCEIESADPQFRGQTRIRALPLVVLHKYWLWQTSRGNRRALALVDALLSESPEWQFDLSDKAPPAQQDENRGDRLQAHPNREDGQSAIPTYWLSDLLEWRGRGCVSSLAHSVAPLYMLVREEYQNLTLTTPQIAATGQ
ncbi:MAG: hypothetical protein KME15_26975 [Drouetiella hepatica Uher 2000/2452]|jgi:hypothetical protein|uniref:Uncharacterized protein n=1 Tax=Drouetiella hepatica Uher 2000/2452 TaxID=904376 RepID=A0A951QJD3_9CYAN|nr:hypothetical protein [Drouetiella hepatica Uher 2000/2452]